MAIRKPRAANPPESRPQPVPGGWPYSIQERTVRVAADGSIRIPATFARLFAFEWEEVVVRLFSDGHVEIDCAEGRHGPPTIDPGARVYMSGEAFIQALMNDSRDE